MRSFGLIGSLAVLALSTPLAAQGNKFRTGVIPSTSRIPTSDARSGKIPPGQLPPAGMCRIWIEGVPPGRQPAPTDCQTAVANKPANARVIWGSDTAFPGNGKTKSKTLRDQEARHGNGHAKGSDDDDDDRGDDDRNSIRRGATTGVTGALAGERASKVKSRKGKGHHDD